MDEKLEQLSNKYQKKLIKLIEKLGNNIEKIKKEYKKEVKNYIQSK